MFHRTKKIIIINKKIKLSKINWFSMNIQVQLNIKHPIRTHVIYLQITYDLQCYKYVVKSERRHIFDGLFVIVQAVLLVTYLCSTISNENCFNISKHWNYILHTVLEIPRLSRLKELKEKLCCWLSSHDILYNHNLSLVPSSYGRSFTI